MFRSNFLRQIRRRPLRISNFQRNTSNLADQTQEIRPEEQFRRKLLNGPNLRDFFRNEHLSNQDDLPEEEVIPYLQHNIRLGGKRKVYFDVYGCQMNVSDTEVVWAILQDNGFDKTQELHEADVILLMTCSIRDGAEEKVWNRLSFFKGLKKGRKKDRVGLKVGLLGCMAERLKEKVLEKDSLVDLVAGPDSYRDLPRLLALTENNQKAVNVLLSLDETYADINPVRLNEDKVSAFVSIMRGCDNMCTYCIVPFTRGRERSRPVSSILKEVESLSLNGVKEVTLLGQNVNSYRDLSEESSTEITSLSKGFKTVYKPKKGGLRFADLLVRVADINPELRIRFTSPHPKDFPDEVLEAIRSAPNICKHLHLPAQSGNTEVLTRMRRGYSRQAYLELVDHIRTILPQVSLSSDFICGFCDETEEEFLETLSLIEQVRYHSAFLFAYSMREKTTAHRRFQDNVPANVKQERLLKMISLYRQIALQINSSQIGRLHLVLVEGFSKRSTNFLQGRNEHNTRVILPALDLVPLKDGGGGRLLQAGDYVAVQINQANSQVLKGIPLYVTGLQEFHRSC